MIGRRLFRCVAAVLLVLIACMSASGLPASAQGGRAWLALGDSYSSGEGIAGTNDVENGERYQGRDCRRATGIGTGAVAYAPAAFQLVAGELGVADQMFVACTGAVSSEIASQIAEAQERKGRATWDVVTMSIGGNDILFSDILKGCLDLNNVWDAFDLTPGCDIAEADIRARIDVLRSDMAGVLGVVASKVAAGGDVIVVGYPHLVEEVARWDRWRTTSCQGIKAWDVPMLRSATGYLNEQLAGAVADANADPAVQAAGVKFHFFDVSTNVYETGSDPASRHGLCSNDPWLNGVTLGVSSGDWRRERSFHPHQVGHQRTAAVLAEFLRANVTFDDVPPPPDPCASPGIDDAEFRAGSCGSGWAVVDLNVTYCRDNPCGDHSQIVRFDGASWQVVTPLPSRMCRDELAALGATDPVLRTVGECAPPPPPECLVQGIGGQLRLVAVADGVDCDTMQGVFRAWQAAPNKQGSSGSATFNFNGVSWGCAGSTIGELQQTGRAGSCGLSDASGKAFDFWQA